MNSENKIKQEQRKRKLSGLVDLSFIVLCTEISNVSQIFIKLISDHSKQFSATCLEPTA